MQRFCSSTRLQKCDEVRIVPLCNVCLRKQFHWMRIVLCFHFVSYLVQFERIVFALGEARVPVGAELREPLGDQGRAVQSEGVQVALLGAHRKHHRVVLEHHALARVHAQGAVHLQSRRARVEIQGARRERSKRRDEKVVRMNRWSAKTNTNGHHAYPAESVARKSPFYKKKNINTFMPFSCLNFCLKMHTLMRRVTPVRRGRRCCCCRAPAPIP